MRRPIFCNSLTRIIAIKSIVDNIEKTKVIGDSVLKAEKKCEINRLFFETPWERQRLMYLAKKEVEQLMFHSNFSKRLTALVPHKLLIILIVSSIASMPLH